MVSKLGLWFSEVIVDTVRWALMGPCLALERATTMRCMGAHRVDLDQLGLNSTPILRNGKTGVWGHVAIP